MRIVLDTNLFISALITVGSPPDQLYRAWKAGQFTLITSGPQLAELARVVRYPHLQRYFHPAEADAMLQGLDRSAVILTSLPGVAASPDPDDNLILATAIVGRADYVVSGDKKDLVFLQEVEGIPILTARAALDLLPDLPL